MKKLLVIVIILGLLSAGVYWKFFRNPPSEPVPQAITVESLSAQLDLVKEGTASPEVVPPRELNLAMTFYSQAPFADWSMPWQEACEEASVLLIANTYFKHDWSKEDFRDQILALVEWENQTFGDYKHTDAAQTTKILNDYLNLQTRLIEQPTFEDIKKSISKGHLLVGLFAGKKIGNPNYKNGGPNYHAMVIKGYKDGFKVITEDVGTRKGEDYVYSWPTLNAALHDYAEPIEKGKPVLIEVIPPSTNER